MRMIEAWLIDTPRAEVYRVKVGHDRLKDYYEYLSCECFTTAGAQPNGDIIYVDDEGLLNGAADRIGMFFVPKWYPEPLVGYGLIVGTDNRGYSVTPKLTFEDMPGLIHKVPFLASVDGRLKTILHPMTVRNDPAMSIEEWRVFQSKEHPN